IDIRTVRPLAYGKQAIVASARYEQNAESSLNSDESNRGHRETFSYIDQFNDNTIGVAFALSSTNSPTQGKKFNAWGYKPVYINNATGAQTDDEKTNGITNELKYRVIGGVKPFVQSDVLKRNSVMGTLEFEPSENFSTAFDGFYSEFEEEQTLRGIELPLAWSSAQLQEGYTLNGDKLVTKGTFTNVQGVIRNDATLTDATVYAVGWNTKFAMGNAWTGDVDISRSSAERTDEILENYTGYIGGPDTLSFESSQTGTKFTSSLDYTDASKIRITNLQSWGGTFVPSSEGGQKGYDSIPTTEDTLNEIRLSASRDLEFSFINKIQVGIARDERHKEVDSSNQSYFALPNHASQGPLPSKTGLTDLSFIGIGSIISYDPLAPKKQGLYNSILATRADVINSMWSVDEEINTAFIKLGVDTEIAGLPLTGDVGVQYVATKQSSDGFSANGEADALLVTPQHGGASYNNTLPSTNLKLEVTEKDFVKLGLARTLTRVGMSAMRASSGFNVSNIQAALDSNNVETSPWSAGGGNPKLKPWVADSVDLSVEHYFNDALDYVSLAAYYKDLKSYVYNKNTLMDFTGFPIPSGLPSQPKIFQGYNNVPTNGSGGIVKGLEFTLSLSGDMISESLSGFGAVFTSSYTDSNITPPDTVSKKLPGLSKNVHGLQLYYDDHGVSIRVSQNYRSSFLGDFSSNIGTPVQRIINETTLLDAQIGYTFSEGALDGLGVSLQGYNLNDEPMVSTDNGDQLRINDYQSYGPTYALNVTYSF
ncbi:MAG: TonB-dependent receptor, partial [Moraxellaceae bacterium]